MKTSLLTIRAVAAAGIAVAALARADVPAYVAVPAQSSLSFIGTQQGEKFTGVLRDYDARVVYAPDQLAAGRIDVTIRVKSLDTKNQERDSALAGGDWFDFAHFPTAAFHLAGLRAGATGPVGDADLTIKGRTKRIAFPFTWKATGTSAVLDARVVLDRLDFGLGAGEWADESVVGRKVEVVVHLQLTPAPAVPAPATAPPRK